MLDINSLQIDSDADAIRGGGPPKTIKFHFLLSEFGKPISAILTKYDNSIDPLPVRISQVRNVDRFKLISRLEIEHASVKIQLRL